MIVPLFVIDLAFFAANVPKIPDGGWLPILVGLGLVIQMTTWRRGRAIVSQILQRGHRRTVDVIAEAVAGGVTIVPGTAIYMFKDPGFAPPAMISNLRHNHVLHETTVMLSMIASQSPSVEPPDRTSLTTISPGIHQVVVTFGYMDEHDVLAELRQLRPDGHPLDLDDATFFIGRETVSSIPEGEMPRWREELFIVLNRGSASASRFYKLPSRQVFEVGTQVDI